VEYQEIRSNNANVYKEHTFNRHMTNVTGNFETLICIKTADFYDVTPCTLLNSKQGVFLLRVQKIILL